MICERRIGGEMEISPADFSAAGGVSAWPDFVGYEQMHCDTGRTALRLALEDWHCKTNGRGRVWAPDYLCSSVFRAIINQGISLATYIDLPGAVSMIMPPTPEDDDLVLIVHYFGKLNTSALAWLDGYPERCWRVLEDCVQSPYSKGVGATGEYAITSLRKWWPVPDGAALYSALPLLNSDLVQPDENFISQRLAAKILRTTGCSESRYLAWIQASEAMLDTSPPRKCSWLSEQLLSGVDKTTALARRRANWQFIHARLHGGVGKCVGISSLYEELLNGEVPLIYPIQVAQGHRDRLRAWLAEHHIYCPIHWNLTESASPAASRLSEKILSIPIDQRYDEKDMVKIIGALTENGISTRRSR